MESAAELIDRLRAGGWSDGGVLALVVAPAGAPVTGFGLAALPPGSLAPAGSPIVVVDDRATMGDVAATIAEIDAVARPRWAMWSSATAVELAHVGTAVARSWDVTAVHRLLRGGWQADVGTIWAVVHGLDAAGLAAVTPANLFNQPGDDEDPAQPVDAAGHLRPAWIADGWAEAPERLGAWAAALAEVVRLQHAEVERVARGEDRSMLARAALAESTAELLCAELMVDGLPMDRGAAEQTIAAFVGPRPRSEAEATATRAARDEEVLRHVPQAIRFDLRSPTQVRSMLRVVGVEVPDTRAWRLESLREVHPLVDSLLTWRKAERIATTFGYAWLDEHLGADGRFRGVWSGADGAAGRMTASAGLHNMPADLRAGVIAEPGHVFVRADLGQIEPRVLAAISGDAALAGATQADDLYAPVAAELGVDRATAKVAVLGAMYGQTTGEGARALQGLQRSYPVAMRYLEAADRSGQVGDDLRTYGGRLVRMGSANVAGMADREARSKAAARGRFGRNAMVQGAAAELFKMWAVTVRARGRSMDATVVMCLHDELLVHVPEDRGLDAAAMVDDALQEAAHRWAPDRSVRFLAETSVIRCWANAKG